MQSQTLTDSVIVGVRAVVFVLTPHSLTTLYFKPSAALLTVLSPV